MYINIYLRKSGLSTAVLEVNLRILRSKLIRKETKRYLIEKRNNNMPCHALILNKGNLCM